MEGYRRMCVRMLRRSARYLHKREAGDGEYSPVPVPAGIRCINTCATSGGFTRGTGNPRTGRRTYAAGNLKRTRRIIPPGARAIRRCVQQENPGARAGGGSRGLALDTIKKLRLRYRDSRYPFKVPVIGCNTINLLLPHNSDVESIVQ